MVLGAPSIHSLKTALTGCLAGPIFKLTLGGEEKLFISKQELMNEVCDEKRFSKLVSGALEQIRNGIEDGLFTAYPGEHNWEIAHRVLMPGTRVEHYGIADGSLIGCSIWTTIDQVYVRRDA
jgi:hypothetical protein